MRRVFVLTVIGVMAALPSAASAGSAFDFSFTTANGGSVAENSISTFPLDMVGLDGLTNDITGMGESAPFAIASLELEIAGLSHSTPMNLTALLIDSFGRLNVIVMDGQGGSFSITGVDLAFNDNAPVPLPVGGQITTGTFLPPALATVNDFAQFDNSGTGAWVLVIINDVRNNQLGGGNASFDSFTLRGTVPEPVTLSLLALGALVTLRRTRR